MDITPGPQSLDPAAVVDARIWMRNGNATNCKLNFRAWNETDWELLGTVTVTATGKYQEETLLRKTTRANSKKLRIDLIVNDSAGQYGYFDDVKVCYSDKSIHITQCGGVTKDFKVRVFLEQAGT